jgi:hypothetical protein
LAPQIDSHRLDKAMMGSAPPQQFPFLFLLLKS